MSYEAALCIQRLKKLGQEQGFLTFMQINDALPSETVDPEKIEAIVGQLTRAGIRVLENSPNQLAKLRLAVPLGRRFDLSSSLQSQSSRVSLAQNTLKPVYLACFTLTSRRLLPDFDVRLGLRNAFNLHYSDPVALYPIADTMPQPGRTFFVELIAHARR